MPTTKEYIRNLQKEMRQQSRKLHQALAVTAKLQTNAKKLRINRQPIEIDGIQYTLFLARLGQQIVGTARVYWEDNGPLLTGLWVKESFRKQQVASSVLRKAVRCVKDKGKETLAAIVKDDNEPAKAFYLKHGFFRYEATPDMPGFSSYGLHVPLPALKKVIVESNPLV